MDCYFNGDILPYADCHVHVSDLQFQRGFGIFEFFRVIGDEIPWLEDYSDRLFRSMELGGLPQPFGREEFLTIVETLRERNVLDASSDFTAFKVIVTGGYSEDLGTESAGPNVMILHLPWTPPSPVNAREGIRLISDRFQRPLPEVKTLFYFNSLRLYRRMQDAGAAEVLYHTDLVTECSRCSVFFVKGGEVFSTGANILDGITRKRLMRQFPEIGTRELPLEEIFGMDEMFITSTSRGIVPVRSVDGRRIGKGRPGKVTRELQASFR